MPASVDNGRWFFLGARGTLIDVTERKRSDKEIVETLQLLMVSGSGHGILARALDTIFEPFFTRKDPGKGNPGDYSRIPDQVRNSRKNGMVHALYQGGILMSIHQNRLYTLNQADALRECLTSWNLFHTNTERHP